MTQTNEIQIHALHMPGTTLRYKICAHRELGESVGQTAHVPMSWFREIGALLRDEATEDLTRTEADALARNLRLRVEIGCGWRDSNPELL